MNVRPSPSRQFLAYNPVVGVSFIPNVVVRVPHEGGGYFVETNSAGFRSRHDFAELPPGKKKVLLFGDSFTAGDGVANRDRYGDILEDLDPDLAVLNLALPGTGTDQQYLTWREWAPKIAHDAIVIAVQVENIRRVAAQFRIGVSPDRRRVFYAKPYFTLEGPDLVLHHQPVPPRPVAPDDLPPEAKVDAGGRHIVVREILSSLGAREALQKFIGYDPLPEYDRPDHPDWLLLRAILEAWIRSIDRPVLLVTLPLYHYVEESASPRAYQARFRELAEATGCALHDPLPDLLRYSPTQRRAFRFRNDIHPTEAGHRALSLSISQVVPRLFELPNGSDSGAR
jgi:lysophospholipase L1-like esterase